MLRAVWNDQGLAILLSMGLLAGCSKMPSRISGPDIDPQKAANAAVVAYDRDGDSALSKAELKQCPSLLGAIDAYDMNHDSKISADEIASRLKSWEASRVGITAATFYLKFDGRRLEGAKIILEPEQFLTNAISTASAETNSSGLAGPSMDAEHLPKGVRSGLQPGLYKIKVTHPKLKIPAKYNDQTELGLEVPPQFDLYHPPTFELSSK